MAWDAVDEIVDAFSLLVFLQVFRAAIAIRLPVDGLHLVVEAFGDSVAPCEALHACDLFSPGMEGVAERDELCKARLPEIDDRAQEARHEVRALVASYCPAPVPRLPRRILKKLATNSKQAGKISPPESCLRPCSPVRH